MKNYTGDLLEANADAYVHVANLYHTFGSGIAYFIKKKYPEAYQADLETDKDCETKLGTFSKADISHNRVIYNLYAMVGIGCNGHPLDRNLSYDHFYNGLYSICEDACENMPLKPVVIGLPKYVGCARAGGEWGVVSCIIENIEQKFDGLVEFHVYELEEPEFNPVSTQPIR